jgi:hypothetical protein
MFIQIMGLKESKVRAAKRLAATLLVAAAKRLLATFLGNKLSFWCPRRKVIRLCHICHLSLQEYTTNSSLGAQRSIPKLLLVTTSEIGVVRN